METNNQKHSLNRLPLFYQIMADIDQDIAEATSNENVARICKPFLNRKVCILVTMVTFILTQIDKIKQLVLSLQFASQPMNA